ncbi:hypothetical protein Zm00014a_001853 [Zea mays]|uniref:Transcription factor ILR3 n=1 Tax=Zea mays TaxID=4577 RepID=A0A3L6DFD9_MAIZE|nr:hypothetical protein Zm00014a_001853 [Zea mays]
MNCHVTDIPFHFLLTVSRFLELGSTLEPGKPVKADKVAILSDATLMVIQLRSEAQQLKETNGSLEENIKELKAEKDELRDEKQKLKLENESLEHQMKLMTSTPTYMPHPTLMRCLSLRHP